VNETTCDILLYAGKWSPRIGRSVKASLAKALSGATGVEVAPAAHDADEPRVTVTVTYPSADGESVREKIHASLLHYLRPEYDSQVEVEIVHQRDDPCDPYDGPLAYGLDGFAGLDG
jgi:hypothetical protein